MHGSECARVRVCACAREHGWVVHLGSRDIQKYFAIDQRETLLFVHVCFFFINTLFTTLYLMFFELYFMSLCVIAFPFSFQRRQGQSPTLKGGKGNHEHNKKQLGVASWGSVQNYETDSFGQCFSILHTLTEERLLVRASVAH